MNSVLVINAGSSSLKYQLLDPATGSVAAVGLIERIGAPAGRVRHTAGPARIDRELSVPDAGAAFARLVECFAEAGPDLAVAPPAAVGHRVVHGGTRFRAATPIDDAMLGALRELTPLAPLHNPANLLGIEQARRRFPDVPHVAVFDTAFHASLPPAAHTYAVPTRWREEFGVRRYGFHGTSHEYVSGRVRALAGRDDIGIVVLHLGNGCSACAVLAGVSVETSMGLTPLEGLVMGTRSGDIDPAIPAHLARSAGLDLVEIDRALNSASGLLGLAGVSDFRTVTERAEAADPAANLALDVVVHRLVKYVGAYAAAMGRLDAIAFTGGIGENSPLLRTRVLGRLGVFGVRADGAANAAGSGERLVTAADSAVAAYVIPTNEELQIARTTAAVLARG